MQGCCARSAAELGNVYLSKWSQLLICMPATQDSTKQCRNPTFSTGAQMITRAEGSPYCQQVLQQTHLSSDTVLRIESRKYKNVSAHNQRSSRQIVS